MLPRDEELMFRSRWLVRIRWIVAAVMVAGALATFPLEIPYPGVALLKVAAFVAVYNIVFAIVAPHIVAKPGDVRWVHWFVNLQIAVDFLALLAWVHFTGGPVSPFLSFFVFHLVLCGLLVSARSTLVHASWVLAVLLLMGAGEVQGWFPHYSPLEHGTERPIDSVTFLLVSGSVTAVTILTVAVLVGGIARRLRRRERELDQTRLTLERHAHDLQTAHAELERISRERNDFFRLVSHQLRAPLTSIQSVLRLITTGYVEGPDRVAETAARAERQAQHLVMLVNDMLSLTQVKSVDDTEDRGPVAVAPLLADVVESLKDTATDREIDLTLRLPRTLPPVWASRNKLEQTFAILVENALKYTDQNGSVSVQAGATGTAVEVAVSDTGIGISPGDCDAIFREFYRAANAKSRQRVGTGLGLSIARRIVEDLGGAIRVESQLGLGSTFTVTLPLAEPATPGQASAQPPARQHREETAEDKA